MDSKRQGRENVGLLNWAGDLMTKEVEKDKVPFHLSLSWQLQPSGYSDQGGDCSKEVVALEKEDQVRDQAGHTNPGMQRGLVNVILRPLSNTFEGDGGDISFPSVPWSGLLRKFLSRNHHKMSRPLNLQ